MNVVCAECLRCRHRGVIGQQKLALYGLGPDVTLAELSRRMRCEACGSHAVKLERRSTEDAQAFVGG